MIEIVSHVCSQRKHLFYFPVLSTTTKSWSYQLYTYGESVFVVYIVLSDGHVAILSWVK